MEGRRRELRGRSLSKRGVMMEGKSLGKET